MLWSSATRNASPSKAVKSLRFSGEWRVLRIIEKLQLFCSPLATPHSPLTPLPASHLFASELPRLARHFYNLRLFAVFFSSPKTHNREGPNGISPKPSLRAKP